MADRRPIEALVMLELQCELLLMTGEIVRTRWSDAIESASITKLTVKPLEWRQQVDKASGQELIWWNESIHMMWIISWEDLVFPI